MEELLKMLATAAVVAAIISGLFSYFTARYVSRKSLEANIKTEWYKGTVREAIEPKVMDLEHRLRRDSLIHEVKFTKVYNDVADTVKELFTKVTDLYLRCSVLVNDLGLDNAQRKKDQMRAFWTDMNDLVAYIATHRLYLPKPIHDEVNDFLNTLRKVYHPMKDYLNQSGKEPPLTGNPWGNAEELYTKGAMPAYEKLCDGVQAYLGLG